MGEIQIDTRSNIPVEYDCDGCGTHHVIDPRDVRRIVRRRKFRCGLCGHKRRRVELANLAIGQHGVVFGACTTCEPPTTVPT